MEEIENENGFDYCEKVDLHALSQNTDLNKVALIANEHGFRGIVVPGVNLDNLVKTMKIYGYSNIMAICALDYPFGNSSMACRNYSIIDSKEKGATEVEIVAPYHLISAGDFKKVFEDLQSLVNTCKKTGMSFKYVVDQNGPFLDDNVRSRMAKIIKDSRVQTVSTSLGYFLNKSEHSDNILKMRTMKNKSGCKIKVYSNTDNPEEIAGYIKAGADIIGLPWNTAANTIHAYQGLIEKK